MASVASLRRDDPGIGLVRGKLRRVSFAFDRAIAAIPGDAKPTTRLKGCNR
jgi:hypothetical protein